MSVKILCEVGINHNGDLTLALDMIKKAVWAGADIVKFQKRSIDKVYTKEELDKPRESPWGHTTREQKLGLEFEKKDYDIINKFCKNMEIEWTASAWDVESQLFLRQYDLYYNKVASPMLLHTKLLETIAEEKKYTFISTGMHSLEQIHKVVDIFINLSCPFELMHCISTYPCPVEEVNLSYIKVLADEFSCNVGFSDHTVGIISSVGAVAMGATSVEKHLTLDRTAYGSDQSSSVEPNGFYKMIEYIREIEKAKGNGIRTFSETEQKIKAKLGRTCDYE